MKTYSGYCYLTFVLGSGSGTTANFLSNQTVHGETVTLTGYSAGLLTAGSDTITFTVRRSNTGTGNLLNIRDGLSGTLTLNYTLNTTACGAPTACSVNSTLSEGNVSLSWSGAAAASTTPSPLKSVQRFRQRHDLGCLDGADHCHDQRHQRSVSVARLLHAAATGASRCAHAVPQEPATTPAGRYPPTPCAGIPSPPRRLPFPPAPPCTAQRQSRLFGAALQAAPAPSRAIP